MSYISYYSTSVGAGYWLSTLEETSSHQAIEINGAAIDSDGHAYLCGRFYPSGYASAYLAKFDTDGSILIDVKIRDSAPNYSDLMGVSLDNFDSPYTAGINSVYDNNSFVVKFNPSEVIQWQRNEAISSVDIEYFGIAVASDLNVYLAGRVVGGGNSDIGLAKFSSSGSLLWDKYLRSGSGSSYIGAMQICVNSRDQICIAADMSTSITNQIGVIQFEADGTLIWQKQLSVPGDYAMTIYNMACDTDDNIYVVGSFNTLSGYRAYIAKYNYLGTLQWQRTLGGTGEQTGTGIAFDAAQNPYICGYDNQKGFVVKYNPAGTIQWQRNIEGLYPAYHPEVWTMRNAALAFDSDDALHFALTMRDSNSPYHGKSLLAKLPNDGSLTGVYGEYTYSVSAMTDSAGVMIDAIATNGFVTRTTTDTAGAYIASDTSIATTVQQLT